jgi:hypothetical protein
MSEGFRAALNLTLVPGELTPEERAAAKRIRREKFTHEGWTAKI